MRHAWNLRSDLTLPAALHNGIAMNDVSNSGTPLKATFRIKLNGKTVAIETVGQAYAFITSLKTVEWIEFQSLHRDAKAALEAAADDAMLTVQATNLLRALFVRAKLL
jgi:hypothetical protein